mgnify:CR=1 FL=1
MRRLIVVNEAADDTLQQLHFLSLHKINHMEFEQLKHSNQLCFPIIPGKLVAQPDTDKISVEELIDLREKINRLIDLMTVR